MTERRPPDTTPPHRLMADRPTIRARRTSPAATRGPRVELTRSPGCRYRMVMVAGVQRAVERVPAAGLIARPRHRLAIVSLAAALLAVGGHAAGGGALPISCGALTSVLFLAPAATGIAAWAAQRTRGPWAALGALAVGQLGTEALLSVPVDDLPPAPLLATVVHALATLALGAMLLGVDRTTNDLGAIADLVLPRWWRGRATAVLSGRSCRVHAARAGALHGRLSPSPRSPRGPPALV